MPNIEGSADVGMKIKGTTVVVGIEARVKVTEKTPLGSVTLLDHSDSISLSKDLTDLKPCADVRGKSGPLIVRGKICVDGEKVCFNDGELLVDFQGEHKITDIRKVCESID